VLLLHEYSLGSIDARSSNYTLSSRTRHYLCQLYLEVQYVCTHAPRSSEEFGASQVRAGKLDSSDMLTAIQFGPQIYSIQNKQQRRTLRYSRRSFVRQLQVLQEAIAEGSQGRRGRISDLHAARTSMRNVLNGRIRRVLDQSHARSAGSSGSRSARM
jgi:hypothetical protein